MGAAGLQPAFGQRRGGGAVGAEALEDARAGDRGLADLGKDRHAFAVAGMAADAALDAEHGARLPADAAEVCEAGVGGIGGAVHHREVTPLDLVRGELHREAAVSHV